MKKMSPTICFFLASVLVPLTRIAFLYNYNATEVPYRGILVLAAVVAVMYIAAFWIAMLAFRSGLSAFCVCLLSWVVIECAQSLCLFVDKTLGVSDKALILIFAVAAVIALILGFLLKKVKRNMAIPSMIAVLFVGILFLFNAVEFVGKMVAAKDAEHKAATSEYYKTAYTIDYTDAGRPDVYWFHLDGMLGFDAFEKYFGDSQEEFSTELEARGFQINRAAEFEALHRTAVALPALVSPYFYDHFVSDWLDALNADEAVTENRLSAQNETFARARLNKELFAAFAHSGYHTIAEAKADTALYHMPLAETIYLYSEASGDVSVSRSTIGDYGESFNDDNEKMKTYFDFRALNEFVLRFMKPFFSVMKYIQALPGIYDQTEDVSADAVELADIFVSPTQPNAGNMARNATIAYVSKMAATNDHPDMVMFCLLDTHMPFCFDKDGVRLPGGEQSLPTSYEGTHDYFTKVLLSMLDYILAMDPDAVIVLQGDHGLHCNTEEEFKAAFGEEANAKELWNSVISAVRVPEQYQTEDMHYALESPLNITRYLVNTFVGENYEYLR